MAWAKRVSVCSNAESRIYVERYRSFAKKRTWKTIRSHHQPDDNIEVKRTERNQLRTDRSASPLTELPELPRLKKEKEKKEVEKSGKSRENRSKNRISPLVHAIRDQRRRRRRRQRRASSSLSSSVETVVVDVRFEGSRNYVRIPWHLCVAASTPPTLFGPRFFPPRLLLFAPHSRVGVMATQSIRSKFW